MWFGFFPGKREECLIGVGENNLLDIVGVARQSGERTLARLDELDLPLVYPVVACPNVVANSDKIGASSDAPNRPSHRAKKHPVFIIEMNIEVFAIRANHDSPL